MTDAIDMDKEFAWIKQALSESKDRWEVIREECPLRVKGTTRFDRQFSEPLQWPKVSRCAGVIGNLDGDRSTMRYCLLDCCPKIGVARVRGCMKW